MSPITLLVFWSPSLPQLLTCCLFGHCMIDCLLISIPFDHALPAAVVDVHVWVGLMSVTDPHPIMLAS